jgi:hypothetical protein
MYCVPGYPVQFTFTVTGGTGKYGHAAGATPMLAKKDSMVYETSQIGPWHSSRSAHCSRALFRFRKATRSAPVSQDNGASPKREPIPFLDQRTKKPYPDK